jgi:hypothetical protein
MPELSLECPHCGSEKIGFQVLAQHKRLSSLVIQGTKQTAWYVPAVCKHCEGPVIAIYMHYERATPEHRSPSDCPSDPTRWGYTLGPVFPAPKPNRVPDHLPEGLPHVFQQAANGLRRGDWDASGAMSRKTVDVATKDLMKDVAKQIRDLAPRIDALANAGRLTEDLRKWAHHVRLGGNDATHDEDPFTKEEAEELLDFTELFLIYVYTLPGKMKEKMKPHPT